MDYSINNTDGYTPTHDDLELRCVPRDGCLGLTTLSFFLSISTPAFASAKLLDFFLLSFETGWHGLGGTGLVWCYGRGFLLSLNLDDFL